MMRGNGRIRGFLGGLTLAVLATNHSYSPALVSEQVKSPPEIARVPDVYIETYVTGYNTVPEQTDETPCISASGANICGRRDIVACPPLLKPGALVEIKGKTYVCEDRTARKYRTRFDINCDKDKRCPYQVTGWTSVKVLRDEAMIY
jgi:hypothetical protein